MGMRINLNEQQVLAMCEQAAVNVGADDTAAFGKWIMETYVVNNRDIEWDIENQLTHSAFELADAFLQAIPGDRRDLRRNYFRHCHRDFLIHPSQVYALLMAGREVFVSDQNEEDEIDLFTTVSWDDFACSDMEWEEWIEINGLYAMDPNS
jgi:hypothetical protein